VWMGDPINSLPMQGRGIPVGRVFGASYPAKIWRETMLNSVALLPPLDFAQPDPTQYPRSQFISELGRRVGGSPFGPPPTFPLGPPPTFPNVPPTTGLGSPPTTRHSPPTTVHSPPTTSGP
jgi:hypothetical protein